MKLILMKILVFVIFVSLCYSQAADERAWSPEEETADFWIQNSEKDLEEALKQADTINTNVARNVILFLGDGMGISTVTAGRVMKGQLDGNSGEETILSMDEFPYSGLSKTYSVNADVSDSSVTATAYLCGSKGQYGTAGLSGKVERGDCAAVEGNEVQSILIDSFNEGKATGIVTTTYVTHATPSATYVHTADRYWYTDSDLTDEAVEGGCKDIATQFIDSSQYFTVAMGGGRKHFTPKEQSDTEYPYLKGERSDGQDLIKTWQEKFKDINAKYVWNKAEFDDIDVENVDKVLALFEHGHMKYTADKEEAVTGEPDEPSLAEMTDKAIKILQRNTNGYFLLVEGGKIDLAHHSNNAYRSLTEFVEFDKAITRAVELTSDSDTLIVVTADHSHTFTMGGYSDRGNPITGLAPSNDDPELGDDGKPYTTLLYGTGPGFQGGSDLINFNRQNLTVEMAADKDYIQQSAAPVEFATHAGEDVFIRARGPMSHLFHGVHEQTYIPYVMRYVSCVGDNKDHCNKGSVTEEQPEVKDEKVAAVFLGINLNYENAAIALYAQFYILLTIVFLITLTICKTSKNISSKDSEVSFYVKENKFATTTN